MKNAAMTLEFFARESGYNEEEHSWRVLVTVSIRNEKAAGILSGGFFECAIIFPIL